MKLYAILGMLQMSRATIFFLSSTILLLNYSFSSSDMLYKPDVTNKRSKGINKWAHLPGINYISALYMKVSQPFHRASMARRLGYTLTWDLNY